MATWKPLVLIGGIPTALPAGDDIGLQPNSDLLTAFAGLTPTSDQLAYFTGASSINVTTLSAFSRAQFANSDAASWRNSLAVAPIESPVFTGVPNAPTPSVGTNNTQVATTAYVVARVANDAVLKVGGSQIGDGTSGAAATMLQFYKNGSRLQIGSVSSAGEFSAGSTAGSYVLRNIGDGVTAGDVVLSGRNIKISTSDLVANNFQTLAHFTPNAISFFVRPTFAGNVAYDEGNLTPSNPPTQLTGATLTNGNNSFWLEEDDSTGEGCMIPNGGIGGIATDYNKVVNLYAKDSNGNKFYIPMLRV